MQLLKQLSNNPSPASLRAGWQLLGACIASFPPNEGFANFLEVWLRKNAQSSDYVGALHNTCYSGAPPRPIEHAVLAQGNIGAVLKQRTDEYAEPLPQGLPPYDDLLVPFDPSVDELEFKRKAPKYKRPQSKRGSQQDIHGAATQQHPGSSAAGGGRAKMQGMHHKMESLQVTGMKHQAHAARERGESRGMAERFSSRASPWKPVVDDASGATYYWNEQTVRFYSIRELLLFCLCHLLRHSIACLNAG